MFALHSLLIMKNRKELLVQKLTFSLIMCKKPKLFHRSTFSDWWVAQKVVPFIYSCSLWEEFLKFVSCWGPALNKILIQLHICLIQVQLHRLKWNQVVWISGWVNYIAKDLLLFTILHSVELSETFHKNSCAGFQAQPAVELHADACFTSQVPWRRES